MKDIVDIELSRELNEREKEFGKRKDGGMMFEQWIVSYLRRDFKRAERLVKMAFPEYRLSKYRKDRGKPKVKVVTLDEIRGILKVEGE